MTTATVSKQASERNTATQKKQQMHLHSLHTYRISCTNWLFDMFLRLQKINVHKYSAAD